MTTIGHALHCISRLSIPRPNNAGILLHQMHDDVNRDTVSCRFLEIDPKAWAGVEKTAASSDPKHHIGAVGTKD